MRKNIKRIAAGLLVLFTLTIVLQNCFVSAKTVKITKPKVILTSNLKKEYKVGEKITISFKSPNYSGKVQYRVKIIDLNKGTSTELYKNFPRSYNKTYVNGNLNQKITIQQNKAGSYRVVIYIKRAGTSVSYDGYVQSSSFIVRAAAVNKPADNQNNNENKDKKEENKGNGEATQPEGSTPPSGEITPPTGETTPSSGGVTPPPTGGTNPVGKIELTQVYLLLNDNKQGSTKYQMNFNKDGENSYSIDLSNVPDATSLTNVCLATSGKAKLTIDYTGLTKDFTTEANVLKSIRIPYDFMGWDNPPEGATLASCRSEVDSSGNVIISIKAVDLSNSANTNTFTLKIKVK
ncbi:hypothetical protein Q428_02585 [Fervidicella metallireducens AeB]|uniref:Uncharacterized protein n=1 Tax=Fervidicella metallireducens AeB TaxID=1403537 RepID=A0A017RXM2_9CLOT|nr:hypothetical protein [Fervidicella metallireducens]EYE89508.1 hypothetical protein Q428_02585 [Fervidicella metallireducens AeB]